MKKNLVLMCMFAICIATYSQEWIDVTDSFVKNPRYDNNDYSSNWEGTALGAYNPMNNAEHYNKTYDTYQTITGVTPGIYRVSLDAFYRSGDYGNDYTHFAGSNASDYQHAKLYANSDNLYSETALPLASSAALQSSLGGNVQWVNNWSLCIPDNMIAANYWFEAGYYDNSLLIKVGESGKLTIGIKKEVTIEGDWTCIDNWKLEQLKGDYVKATSLSLNETSLNLGYYETYQLKAEVLPSNTLYTDVLWTSSDPDVVSVNADGKITAKAKGTAVITATTCDGSDLSASCTVTETEEPSNEDYNYFLQSGTSQYSIVQWGSYVSKAMRSYLKNNGSGSICVTKLTAKNASTKEDVEVVSDAGVLGNLDSGNTMTHDFTIYSDIDLVYEWEYTYNGNTYVFQSWQTYPAPASIDGVTDKMCDGSQNVYTISGQRISQPRKGLNIINGKKVLVK